MTTLAGIRAAIAAELLAIPGIGQVHDRERYAKTDTALRTLYVHGAALRGWYIRRVQTWETSPAIGRATTYHRWLIRGFHSFDDAAESELAFDDLIEAIRDRFRAATLGGVVSCVDLPDDGQFGIRVEDSGTVMFCGVLCHAAKLSLYTRHEIE